ncbi:hypothetical protein [Paenibacillus amylolyticus]|uniref:hypothetical protein n=1 Tax=Paenibacillus amylolyticus TaxID=1451 RepID=UPI00344B8CAE
MEFYYNDALTNYKVFTTVFRSKLGELEKQSSYASPPEIVAETIYQAATYGTNQFRYVVGPNSKMLINIKERMNWNL